MTVSTTNSKKTFVTDGIVVAFDFDFMITDESDLILDLYTADDVYVSTYTYSTDYTLDASPWPTGGTATFYTAPVAGKLLARRDVDSTQETDWTENTRFPAESHEAAADKLTLLIQEIEDKIGRSISLSAISGYTDLTIPDPVAGKYLQWKSDLSGLKNVALLDATAYAVSSYIGDFLNDETLAEALTTLGVASDLRDFITAADAASARLALSCQSLVTPAADNNIAVLDVDTGQLVDGGQTIAQIQAADRDRANHTGTIDATDLAATSAETDWVLGRIAGLTAGSVGTYAMLFHNTDAASITAGTAYSGSLFSFCGFRYNVSSDVIYHVLTSTPSGTWLALANAGSGSAGNNAISMFVRIS